MCEPEKNIPNFLLLGVYHLANCPPKVLLDLLEEDSIPITCSSKRNTMFANRYQTEWVFCYEHLYFSQPNGYASLILHLRTLL